MFVVYGDLLMRHAEHAATVLDLAPDPVDDMYEGCAPQMEKVADNYLKEEYNREGHFHQAWAAAQKKFEPKSKLKSRGKSKLSDLQMRQRMAVYAYTLDQPRLYEEFNQAVRTEGSSYRTTFQYHALHFYLTTAVQSLKSKQGNECRTGYRRVNVRFPQVTKNKLIRFGSFTSSCMGSYSRTERFGKTCFKIESCFGADISLSSKFGESERELLIPPYEVFKVTAVMENPEPPCDVEYQVKSTRIPESKWNCALVNHI
ncbi:ecto-ADP-ribosyltransferase 5-like [Synchiropus picturatus]